MAAAWQGKELLLAVYAAVAMPAARAALDRFYHWAGGVQVPELSRLAGTVRAWEAEILAFHSTMGCSNGPTEAVTCSSRRSSGSGMASATSPTTDCGCCCTAAWRGRPTGPQACEPAHSVGGLSSRRAACGVLGAWLPRRDCVGANYGRLRMRGRRGWCE